MGNLKKQLMSLSELDDRIQFVTKTDNTGDHGTPTVVYTPSEVDVYAKVRYVSTNEGDSNINQEKFTTEIKIWIRKNSTGSEYKYVQWDGNYYDIFAYEKTPKSRFHIIKARLIET